MRRYRAQVEPPQQKWARPGFQIARNSERLQIASAGISN